MITRQKYQDYINVLKEELIPGWGVLSLLLLLMPELLPEAFRLFA